MSINYRTLGLLAGVLATIASLFYIAASVRGHDLSQYASPQAVAALAAAIAAYALTVPVAAWAWRGLLASIGVQKSFRRLFAIVGVSQIGKYLPGNFGQHVGRVSMSLACGMAPRPLLVTVLVEALLIILSSALVGLAALVLSGVALPPILAGQGWGPILVAALVLAVVVGLPLLAHYGPVLGRRLPPKWAATLAAGNLPPVRAMLHALLKYAALFIAIGFGIYVMAALLLPGASHNAWLVVSSFSVAWVAGFAAPGAPAGLGVREGVMLLLLGTWYAPAESSVMVLSLRLATTLGDVLLLALGYIVLRRIGKADGELTNEA